VETFDSLLAMLRRTTDEFGWLQPILDDMDSATVLGAMIQVFARLGVGVDHNGAQGMISTASGGQVGSSTVTVSRAAGGTSGILPLGYGFIDARGVQAIATVAVAVGSGVTSLSVPVATLRKTELVNSEDDPGFMVDPASLVVNDGAGGVLFAPAALIFAAARVLATTNQALTGLPTIDGVALGANDRVLLTGQTAQAQNGLWVAASGAWARPEDFLVSSAVLAGMLVPVAQGTTHGGQLWQLTTTAPYVLGTTPLAFAHVGLFATVFTTIGPSDPIQGAAADYLSVWGSERGQLRQAGETEGSYRQRIRNMPDAVSPIAVAQSAQQMAQQLGLPPVLVLEPFDDGATPALKASYGLGSFGAMFGDDQLLGFFDDPESGLFGVDRRMATAYFEVQLQDLVRDPQGYEFFFDDGGFGDDPVLGFPEGAPSLPPGVTSALLALYQDVSNKKAGGVQFDIALYGLTLELGEGQSSGASPTKVFDLAPASGQIWWVSEAFAGHDCSSLTLSPHVSHFLVYDLEDGTHLTTPVYRRQDTQRATIPTQRVTGIHGWVQSDGFAVGNLVAWFWVRSVLAT